ncbi:type II toxin-antitoxin system prevent-host-death family antitoxin [Xenorhabdus sp. KK7.4]|uniref:type II toxin-antitoxin system prevent-host-death family antitoxin n=1 Tax=Xenorhabdus sp. KK7.4 TaxID=1851572 RepID=UPI000C03D7F3|nr:type II toxin-antitoxin system prevent-host-death family antitoxin [Xenorhabdus sp. KK7.4]PHM51270.1 prevent-host-death family protein [Xenorhabdus sp. KK7.4]
MKTINYSEARQNFAALMNECTDDRVPIKIIRQKSSPACVMLSYDEYRALEETSYLLRSPANARHLMDSIEALNNGKGIEVDIQE